MTYSLLAARAVIGAAALAVIALATLHILKPDVHPSRNMISLYALGRYGWVMALCFAAFAAATACLFAALVAQVSSILGGVGLAFLLLAAVAQRSFSGKMHGVSFLIGVPCQILSVLLLSVALSNRTSYALPPLLGLTAVIWLSLGMMIAIMVMVGPGKEPNPKGPERFLGLPNRLFMVSYGVWLIVVAWPIAC
jgi:hypothetical protein